MLHGQGRFCYLCGKVTEELVENRCRECYLGGGRFLTLPERIEAQVCRNCHTYLKGGRWLPMVEGLEAVIKNAALDVVKENLRLEKVEAPEVRISVEEPKESSPTVYLVPCTVEVGGRVAGLEYSARQEAVVRVVLDLCQDCSRASGKYYEAILQVRGEGALGREERDKIHALVEEFMAQYARTDRKAFVSKFEALKEGSTSIGSYRWQEGGIGPPGKVRGRGGRVAKADREGWAWEGCIPRGHRP